MKFDTFLRPKCVIDNNFEVVVVVNVNDNKRQQKLLYFLFFIFLDYQERDETNNQRIQELEEELSGEFE